MSLAPADELAELRALLVGMAYRMLGSVADAEDAAQEALLRLHQADPPPDVPRAWLTTVITRLCLDRLRSAQARRETYVGPWLPEPLLTAPDPAEDVARAESLSLALLVVLERLSAAERAAWVLHDVFDYGYDEVADALGRSEPACRQLVSRARRAVAAGRPRFEPDPARRAAVAGAFFAAVNEGDLGGLVALLAEDAVLRADSGGERPSPRKALVGPAQIAKVLIAFRGNVSGLGWTFEPVPVNGTPGVLVLEGGQPDSLVGVDVAEGRVIAVHILRQPAKLRAALTTVQGGEGFTP